MQDKFISKEAIMDMINQQNKKYKENIAEEENFINSLDPKEMIEQLKHSVYRNVKLVEILDLSFNTLSTAEKIALEALDDLILSNINAMKWIANKYDVDVNFDFGDTILKKDINNVKLGRGKITKENKSSLIDFDFEQEKDD
jgi:hypothetical protein